MLILANIRNSNTKEIKGIIYGKNFKNIKIKIKNKYWKINKESKIKIKIMNKTYKTKVKNIQYHPYKKKIIHIEFEIENNEV